MYRYFAGVIVQNDRGEILCLDQIRKEPSWRIPGGKVESGESPREAALRELREETGLLNQFLTLVGENQAVVGGDHWHGYIFTCRLMKGEEPRIMEPEKTRAMAWFKARDVVKINWLLARDLARFLLMT